ncbi:MAG: hypothetical protein OJF49_001573 [Ktedonobacterales bacterium]|nr:MAG: hypothetical protein OJF49_001573 [Ktedonobacterales bacterium]
MAIFVDSAVLADVEALRVSYPVTGVTTNPTILLAAIEQHGQRLDDISVLRELLRIVPGPVFMQPSASDAAALTAQAQRYAALDRARVVLKLPMTEIGLAASNQLQGDGIRYCFTAVYTLAQAYTAAMAGAEWVIPYFGRMLRAGTDAAQRIHDMAALLAAQDSACRILVASLKSPEDVATALLVGAHDITAPAEVIRSLVADPLTTAAVAQFDADWQRAQDTLR